MHGKKSRREFGASHPVRIISSVAANVLAVWCGVAVAADGAPDFEREIVPLIAERCLECHSGADASGGLNLTRREMAIAGGDNGQAIQPGDPDSSLLVTRVSAGEMPPEKNGKPQPLSAAEVALLRHWVRSGAAWPDGRVLDPYERTTAKRGGRDWWSLQPVQRPKVPEVADVGRIANPIDAFVQQKLNERNFTAAPPADRRTLLRRVTFDLIGLPPSPEEIDAFVADQSPHAYDKVVDRLLDSPHFGERQARWWLDLVRFAETNGYERDAEKPYAWRYRDWVIDAFNDDKPYDHFVLEQLAGDELPDRSESTAIATGFLRLGTWDDEPNDPLEYQYDRLEDLVHTTATAFLGLSVKCARCHDHKFDPIPQTDYYRVAAAFWGGPVAHRQRELNGGPTKEELGFDVLGWTDITRDPPPLHVLKKGNVHRPGAAISAGSLTATVSFVRDFSPPAADAKSTHRRLQLAQWIVDPQNPLTVRVMVNRLWQQHFGEGLVRSPDNFGFLGQKPTHPQLLDWLASELIGGKWRLKRIHKLMVMSETYRQSSIHPQQAVYEQRDANNLWFWRANRRRLDAESLRDAILWTSGRLDLRGGGPSFRAPISAEALEGLSMKTGGYRASLAEDTHRRSIYMFVKRALPVPLMSTFDACDTTSPTGRRDVTIVAPQALALMNNEWVHEETAAFAKRVLAAASSDSDRVDKAWCWAFGRRPAAPEREAALAYLQNRQAGNDEAATSAAAWASLCHVLINANEFIYTD